MIEPQSVVQIYSTDADGDLCIGTGYFCNEDLVITAKHVVFSGDHISSGLKLVFPETATNGSPNYQYDINQAIGFTKDDIVFLGNEQLDIAVIRCPKTPRAAAKVKFAAATPSADSPWYIRGFPKAGKAGAGQREQLGFGVAFQGMKTPSVYELHTTVNLDASLFKNENGWGGLSGAPVFADNQLVAVITDKYKTLDSYFYALSIPYLLRAQEAFRKAVGLDKQSVLTDILAHLAQKIIAEIHPVIAGNTDLLAGLVKEIQLAATATAPQVAKHLVQELTIGEAIGSLATVSLDLEQPLLAKQERWQNYLHDVEQVCGWLLINSLDDEWWFNNEQCAAFHRLTHELPLDEQAFVEIIISRNLVQQARYGLDGEGNLVPTNASRINDTLLFDAITPDASYTQLLSLIYKDLRRSPTSPQNIGILLEEIGKTAKKLYERRKNKVIYYLVSSQYLDALKNSAEHFQNLEQQLNGYVQFICCVANTSSNISASKEDQASLLEDVAIILRLKNSKS